ncbi:hypothetical protein [Mucilaginibacter phyllosphaerae]
MESNQDDANAALDKNVEELLTLYMNLKPSLLLKKTLAECLENRLLKIEELKDMYLPQLQQVKFLKAAYFDDHVAFNRYQDISDNYFLTGCEVFFFLSHQWETVIHPDPNGTQFQKVKKYLAKSPREENEVIGYWYDFSCSPQRDADGKRTLEEESEFVALLKIMHVLTALSLVVVIYSDGYLNRSWCCAEWIMATNISPLFDPELHPFPFGNLIKFSQLALLISYLKLDAESARRFMEGEDLAVMALVNTVLGSTIKATATTYEDDKQYLQGVLHRHFWYHMRLIGLRTELLTAFRLFENYSENIIRSLLGQFLYYTKDPFLNWTRIASFSFETMIKGPDPFDEITFHGKWIEVTSNSDTSHSSNRE